MGRGNIVAIVTSLKLKFIDSEVNSKDISKNVPKDHIVLGIIHRFTGWPLKNRLYSSGCLSQAVEKISMLYGHITYTSPTNGAYFSQIRLVNAQMHVVLLRAVVPSNQGY